MSLALVDRVRNAWNAFVNPESAVSSEINYGGGVSYGGISPSRPRFRYSNERSIISSIYTRIGIDVAGVTFHHIKLDDQGRYSEEIHSNLNSCLTLEANIDQGPRAFRQDIVMTLF